METAGALTCTLRFWLERRRLPLPRSAAREFLQCLSLWAEFDVFAMGDADAGMTLDRALMSHEEEDKYALQARAGKALLKVHQPESAPIPGFDPLDLDL